MDKLKYDVSSLLGDLGASRKIAFSESFGDFETVAGMVAFAGELTGDLELTNIGGFLQLKGMLAGTLDLKCSRCLVGFRYPLNIKVDEMLSENEAAQESEEDAFHIVDETVDLEPVVKSAVMLSLPMKFLCSGSCLGLCPSCGINFNESKCECTKEVLDPRLAKLKELLEPPESP